MSTEYTGTESISEEPTSPVFVSEGINSTMTRTYAIRSASHAGALALLKGLAPASATVDTIPLEAPPKWQIASVDRGVYKGTVDYKHAGRDEQQKQELINIGDERVASDFQGQSIHVTTAKSQTRYGTSSINTRRAVNAKYDGTVDGVDINDRTGSFQVDVLVDEATVTNAWLKARYLQVWTFNNATFRSWPAGSVALTGMTTRQRSDGNWDISYSFQIFPGETVTDIGGISTGGSVTLKGSDYKWLMYRPKLDTGTTTVEPEAIGAYVAKLYDETDFADLGIST